MSITLSQVAPSNFLAPAAPLTLLNVDNRYQYLRFTNNSTYQLSINMTGTPLNLSEFSVKDVEVPKWWQGQLTVTPTVNISTASHAQSNLLTIEGFYKGEIDSPISQQIPQQAVTATASGKPLFSATFGIGASVGNRQAINVFNPPNSGVTFTFHSAEAFSNRADWPTANLMYLIGGDLNLPVAVNAVSHNGTANPPVSFAHCTAMDQNSGNSTTSIIEVQQLEQNTVTDLLNFPDNYTLSPGGNLRIEIIASVANNLSRVTLKWSEDIALLPQGGVPTGVVMTSIVNTGNPAPTPVVTASPLAETTATLINNDGTATFGSATRTPIIKFADAGSSAQPVLTTDNTGTVNLAALLASKQIGLFVGATKVGHIDNGGIHLDAGVFDTSGSGNAKSLLLGNNQPAQIKDSTGTARDVLYVDGANATDLQGITGTDVINLKKGDGTTIAHTNASGLNLDVGTFKFLTGSISRIAGGFVSTTNAGTVVTHNFGVVPDVAFVTVDNGGSTIVGTATALTTTQATIWVSVAGATNVWWLVIKF